MIASPDVNKNKGVAETAAFIEIDTDQTFKLSIEQNYALKLNSTMK